MPSRNIIKIYVENGYYHLYNRGVEKRTIFEDSQDYGVFLSYLKEYLSPPDPSPLQGGTLKNKKYAYRLPKNYFEEIFLLAYCLMPNHFHLLVNQKSTYAIKNFMQSLLTRYSMYFNKKYSRVGKLFQGHYKGAIVRNESYLLHLTRYIHLNPSEYTKDLEIAYSSYADYLGLRNTSWVKKADILAYFSSSNNKFKQYKSYKSFIEENASESGQELVTLEE